MISLAAAFLLLQDLPEPYADPADRVVVAPNATHPSLAFDADGHPHVAFVAAGNVAVASSSDAGKSFGPPVVALDAKGAAQPAALRGPRLAVDRRHRLYVVAPLPPSNDLHLAVSADRGKTFGKPVLVNDAAGATLSASFAVAAGPAEIHVAWLEVKPGKGPSLCHAKFSADGKRVGKTQVLASPACDACPPAVAVDAKGNPAVAYRQGAPAGDKKPVRDVMVAVSPNGGASFPPFSKVNSIETLLTAPPREGPALAFDGKILAAAWMDHRDVGGDRNVYWRDGSPGNLGPEDPVNDDRRYSQGRPSLTLDASGTAWCAWEDGRRTVLRVFVASTKQKANAAVGTEGEGKGSAPALAASGARVGLAYESGDAVAFRLLAGRP